MYMYIYIYIYTCVVVHTLNELYNISNCSNTFANILQFKTPWSNKSVTTNKLSLKLKSLHEPRKAFE